MRQARGCLGEDTPSAADVEVVQGWGRRGGCAGEAAGDEGVAEGVHEV